MAILQKKPEYNINRVNPLYLLLKKLDGFIEEIEGSKYLNIALTDSNEDVLMKYTEVWEGIKNQVEKIRSKELGPAVLVGEYGKDYMKIKFNSDDDLPLNKILKFHVLTIIIRNVFEKDGILF